MTSPAAVLGWIRDLIAQLPQRDPRRAGQGDGTTRPGRNQRFTGAKAITLRREMQRRGIDDPRFVTAARAAWINRENNATLPVVKPGAQPIELVANPNRRKVAVFGRPARISSGACRHRGSRRGSRRDSRRSKPAGASAISATCPIGPSRLPLHYTDAGPWGETHVR